MGLTLSQNTRRHQPLSLGEDRRFQMNRITPSRIALGAAMGALALATPAQAHGVSGGGLAAGFLHPLTGLDHLVMLMAVGTAAAMVSPRLLVWALGGSVLGALLACAGLNLPAAEVLAALAIALVALLALRAGRPQDRQGSSGAAAALAPVVALGMAVHALLHCLEIPSQGSALLWWAGALSASVLIGGGSTLLLRRLPAVRSAAAAAFLLVGGCLTLAALAAQLHAIPA
jgi:urease accessory protein